MQWNKDRSLGIDIPRQPPMIEQRHYRRGGFLELTGPPVPDRAALARVRAGRKPLAFEQLVAIDEHADHEANVRRLARSGEPAVVIAASGMCAGGRVMNYLKAMLHDPRHDVLFVGYQARGTPGHAIQAYGPGGGYVDLDGERIDLLPMGADDITRCKPIYEKMPGWADSTVGVTSYDALPVQARNYLERIEQVTGVPIAMISTSPDRDHTILVQNPYAAG